MEETNISSHALSYNEMFSVDNIKKRFDESLSKGNQEEINKELINNIYLIPFDLFKYMIENGADPHYSDDYIFIAICGFYNKFGIDDTINKLNYLVNLGANINAQQSKALECAIQHSSVDDKVINFLLENGATITDNVIIAAVSTSKKNILDLLVKYGVDVYKIAKLFWKYYIVDYDFILDKMEEMCKNGLDLNQSISQFYSNKN
ncbi:repeat protein [Tupanvirus deep ocean]|uniref:Repeat protein n=2 Tax=Tupanvirus TaxID=2094720 RepID=A0AC62A8J7_9VIRU|nr:repeat protein [Tupanvirus deep ocean]QKU34096.1 repeat protein [Tupanvirus deep ocean]